MNYLTIVQAAEQANVAPVTIRRAILQGKLPAYRVGRLYRIDSQDLDSYIRAVPAIAVATIQRQKISDTADWREYFAKKKTIATVS